MFVTAGRMAQTLGPIRIYLKEEETRSTPYKRPTTAKIKPTENEEKREKNLF